MVFKLGANVGEAVQGMNLVQQRVQYLESSIKYFQEKLANTQSQKFYAYAIQLIAKKKQELAQITRATGGALEKGADSTRRATSAMTDLGRVVQDAPYGFIGIANNINPLVESFGRLKKETGSTGGAFKALAGSLAGPAGIGLAISVGTSLLVAFGGELFKSKAKSEEYVDALNKVSTQKKILTGETLSATEAEKIQTEQLQDQANEFKKLNELIQRTTLSYAQRQGEARGAAQEEIALVNALASVIQNQNLSYEQRNNALLKLKSINQGYFGDLTLEANSLATLTEKVKQYTNALVAQEVVKGYTKDLADATIAQNKFQTQIDRLLLQRKELQRQLSLTPKEQTIEVAGGDKFRQRIEIITDEYRNLENQINDVNNQLDTQYAGLNSLGQASKELTTQLDKAVVEASKFKAPEIKPPKVGKVKVDKKKVEKDIKGEFDKIQVGFDFVNPVLKALQAPEILTEAQKIGKLINESIEKNVKPLKPETLSPNVTKALEKQKTALEKQLELGQNVANGISNAFGQAFGSILEGENVFTALGKSLKGFVLELIQATVKALIFRAIVNAFVPGGSQALGATGIANLLGFRANGGPVTGQAPYIVGERGPELFVPSVSGNILPNNRLSSFNGRPAFATSMGGRSIVRGNDILLASARTQRSQNRVNA